MKSYLRHTTAILLFAIAGPSFANAQTLMDYMISREKVWGTDCAPTPAAGCAAPVTYDSGWQAAVDCGVPTSTAYVMEVPGSCTAPPACCPRSMDVCYTSEPTCAIPSTPCRSGYAPAACQCPQDGCRYGQGSPCHGGSKRGCCCCSGWCRAHTTGDLYPHFPYLPEYGGTYYFRPYNADTVYQQAAEASQWGLPAGNPYSVSNFAAIYEVFEQRYPRGVSIPEPPLRHEKKLPSLESLMRPVP